MSSWQVDPETGDYITHNGEPVPTDSVAMPAYFRLKVKRQTWMYAPDQKYGSDYHLVKKRPTAGQNGQLEAIGERALQPLVDDGRVDSAIVTVNTEVTQRRSNVILNVNIVDAQQKEQNLNLPAIIGG